ncbi:MAG: PHP domain-containing protein [Deltaproteobacteria bacterium]
MSEGKLADLHIHTVFSDGTLTPEQVVEEAIRAGIACIALTDHDNTDGIEPALAAAGKRIEVLPAIETSTEVGGEEVHILGYLIEFRRKSVVKMLAEMRRVRVDRIHRMCRKLKDLDIPLTVEEVFAEAGAGSVGRLHVAQALRRRGFVATLGEAFAKYIGDRGPAYVGKFKMTPAQAIRWIRQNGGVPVLAHPYTLSDNALIGDFVKAGIMGLEAYYPEHTAFQTQAFVGLAQRDGLLVTGGSDFHGEAKPHIKIGKASVAYAHVERLKAARCGIG